MLFDYLEQSVCNTHAMNDIIFDSVQNVWRQGANKIQRVEIYNYCVIIEGKHKHWRGTVWVKHKNGWKILSHWQGW